MNAIEYGLVAALIAVAAITAMEGLTSSSNKSFEIPASKIINLQNGCLAVETENIDYETGKPTGKGILITCSAGYALKAEDDGLKIRITPPAKLETE